MENGELSRSSTARSNKYKDDVHLNSSVFNAGRSVGRGEDRGSFESSSGKCVLQGLFNMLTKVGSILHANSG
jgi:hypothetical protein